VWVNACFFVGIGFGLHHSWLGGRSIPLGVIGGASMLGISQSGWKPTAVRKCSAAPGDSVAAAKIYAAMRDR
jgi:hypothetical protein